MLSLTTEDDNAVSWARDAPYVQANLAGGGRSILVLVIVAGPIAVLPAVSGYVLAAATLQAQATTTATASSVGAVLDQYCVTCHNERRVTATGPTSVTNELLRETGLAFDVLDVTRPSDNLEAWEAAIKKLRAGTMPPGGSPRPDMATYDVVASWLETEIDRGAAASPNPGRNHTVHRLNRTEYTNAIRDLFALEIDGDALLPGDETSDTGFDNQADFLSISTAQLERYMSAAGRSRASRRASLRQEGLRHSLFPCFCGNTTGRAKISRSDLVVASRFVITFRSTASI